MGLPKIGDTVESRYSMEGHGRSKFRSRVSKTEPNVDLFLTMIQHSAMVRLLSHLHPMNLLDISVS